MTLVFGQLQAQLDVHGAAAKLWEECSFPSPWTQSQRQNQRRKFLQYFETQPWIDSPTLSPTPPPALSSSPEHSAQTLLSFEAETATSSLPNPDLPRMKATRPRLHNARSPLKSRNASEHRMITRSKARKKGATEYLELDLSGRPVQKYRRTTRTRSLTKLELYVKEEH
jgi:hypothetical protein